MRGERSGYKSENTGDLLVGNPYLFESHKIKS